MRIGIIHGHPITLWALRQILSLDSRADVATARSDLPVDPPRELDVLVLDIDVAPEPARLAFIEEAARSTRLLIMATSGRSDELLRCLESGAEAYVPDLSTPSEVLHAVFGTPADADLMDLSARERQVLDCIARGLTQYQAARRLGISVHTVDTYTRRIRKKLGLGNKAELTRAALVGVPALVT